MSDSKPCLAGCGTLIVREGKGRKHFSEQMYCSRACAYAHRKVRPGGDHRKTPSERAARAMNKHWQIQQAIAAAKAARVPARASRAEEMAAMEQFIAARGVTECPASEMEPDPVRTTDDRPRVMPGWRG